MKPKRKVARDPKVAIGYVRVSTTDQALGLEAQRTAITAWCANNKVDLSGIFTDEGVSGGAAINKRPGLCCALETFRLSTYGLLVVSRWDRLARDAQVSGFLTRDVAKMGGQIISADGVGNEASLEGQLIRGVFAHFAEYERGVISMRISRALAVKKTRNEVVGKVPYGFVREGDKLVPCPKEQRILADIRALRADGRSIRWIAQHLNATGRLPKTGQWHYNTLRKLLMRETDDKAHEDGVGTVVLD